MRLIEVIRALFIFLILWNMVITSYLVMNKPVMERVKNVHVIGNDVPFEILEDVDLL